MRETGTTFRLIAALWGVCLLGAASAAEPPAKPRVPVNLIVNSDFEVDADRDGVPDGWWHSSPQYWCGPAKNSTLWKELRALWVKKGAEPPKIPFRPPDTPEGGAYNWEAVGQASGHSISIDETAEQKWGEWDTVVKGIKPNTSYVIMGWRKQSAAADRKPGVSPWLKVAAFGGTFPVRGTIRGEAWVPFALEVGSGRFQGDCSIGLVVATAPTKVWLDRVRMFEGTLADVPRFRFGHRGAALEYPFHAAAYASPDLDCPLFFDLAWSMHNGNGGSGLEVVIDLPKGLDLSGGECGMGLKLDGAKVESVTIAGRPYVRRSFSVLSVKDRPEFDSAGRRAVRLWVGADPAVVAGEFQAYYRARWRGGAQSVQRLRVKVIRIPSVKRRGELVVGLGGVPARLAASRAEKLVKDPAGRDLAAIGFNRIFLDAPLDAKVAERFEKAGIFPVCPFTLDGQGLPKDAVARDIKGQPIPGMLCPTYRAANAIKTVFAGPATLVRGGGVGLITDLRAVRSAGCYGERCVKEFEAVFKKRHADAKYVPPSQFEAAPDQHKDLHAAWHEFRRTRFAQLYRALRAELDTFRKSIVPPVRNASKPLSLVAMVPTPTVGLAALGRGAMLDYTKMAEVLDLMVIEPRPELAELGGTPAYLGREVAGLVKPLGLAGKAGVVISAGTCDDRAAMTPVVRHADIRAQVLEAVVAGAKAVILQPLYAVDGMHIKQFAEALNLLAPFDEIIERGEPCTLVSTTQPGLSVRCLDNGGRRLILVSDYSAQPAKTAKLDVKQAADAKAGPGALVDVESATVVLKQVSPTAKSIELPLGTATRLFYLGPVAKFPLKLTAKK